MTADVLVVMSRHPIKMCVACRSRVDRLHIDRDIIRYVGRVATDVLDG